MIEKSPRTGVYHNEDGAVIGVVLQPGDAMTVDITGCASERVEVMHTPFFDEDAGGHVSLVKDRPTEIAAEPLTDAITDLLGLRDNAAYDGINILYEGQGYLLRFVEENTTP